MGSTELPASFQLRLRLALALTLPADGVSANRPEAVMGCEGDRKARFDVPPQREHRGSLGWPVTILKTSPTSTTSWLGSGRT